MDKTRRRVLRMGVLTAASAALPLEILGQQTGKTSSAAAVPTPNQYDAFSYLTAADFKPFVNAAFSVQTTGSPRLALTTVQSPPILPTDAKTSTALPPDPLRFALRFKSLSGPALKQGTYIFENSSLGSFAIFIVPSAPNARPMFYTAHVNRSVQ